MEQSSIRDLRDWVDELAIHMKWETACTPDGDWSFTTPKGIDVLVEANPEMDSRSLVFTAAVAKVDKETKRELLLGLLTFNGSAMTPCPPILAYAPTGESIVLRFVFQGTVETWSGDNFLRAIEEFSKTAEAISTAINDGTFMPSDFDAAGQTAPTFSPPSYA